MTERKLLIQTGELNVISSMLNLLTSSAKLVVFSEAPKSASNNQCLIDALS